MEDEDYDSTKVICAAADLATSMAQSADRTSITVGGKDLGNFLHVVDQRKGKWPSDVIVEQMFAVQQMWTPDVFFVEGGAIWNTLAPMIYKEMQERDTWINFQPVMPTKDKASRGRPFQRRHRARSMKFDKEAPWYEEYEAELLRFTGVGQAVRDDQFDSTALLVLGFETISNVEKDDLMSEDEQEFQQLSRETRGGGGRNTVTGY
jgi:predicted phage terminase large subunit-like protein